MSSAQNHSTLKWIRGELDLSLTETRRTLEGYVESGDPSLIDECISRLHQLHGSLQMMQIYGAAMLAEEMELVAGALRDGLVNQRDAAAEAVMLGVIQLSEYLEKLESGARDLPILLLPLLNELRATRDASLLSEVAFYSPELDRQLQLQDEGEANPELPAYLRKVRHKYHKGLLDWYRGSDVEGGLQAIADIIGEIQSRSGKSSVQRVFRTCRALATALREGSVERGLATKQLIGRVDRLIKWLIDSGESSLDEALARELLRNSLYYLASAVSQEPQIREIQQEFDLARLIPDAETISQERDHLQSPGRALFESLKSAISEDLTRIKDGLDLFIRTQSDDLERLEALREPMTKLADTLGMVGQGGLRSRLKRQAESITGILASGHAPSEQELMAMAGDLLFIETSLVNLSESRPHYPIERLSAEDESALPEGEFERLVDSVMHEASIEMAKCKDAVIGFIDEPQNSKPLQDVPPRFRIISGAFRILKLNEPVQLLERLSNFVQERLIGADSPPEQSELNSFADAITSIEYYMEAIVEGRGIQADILAIARQALENLGLVMEPEQGSLADADEQTEPASAPVQQGESQERPVRVAEPQPVETASAKKPPLEDIDPEILDIFIEEAREEIEVIQEYFPRWVENREDRDALITFRRSFHTLKGSGRLVGASTIGELAWSIENLLNRVIEGTIEDSPAMIAVVRECIDVLPGLVDAQESGQPHEADVKGIMDRAFTLADPNYIPVAEPEEPEVSVEPEEPDEALLAQQSEESLELVGSAGSSVEQAEEILLPPDESAPATPAVESEISMDPVLLEIFESESRGHIDTLREFVRNCRDNEYNCRIDERLARAWHTLHGSAKMAEVPSIAAISSAGERYFNQLAAAGVRTEAQVVDLLERSVDAIDTILAAINQPAAELPDWPGVVASLEGAIHALIHPVAESGSAAEIEEITGEPTPEDEILVEDITPVEDDRVSGVAEPEGEDQGVDAELEPESPEVSGEEPETGIELEFESPDELEPEIEVALESLEAPKEAPELETPIELEAEAPEISGEELEIEGEPEAKALETSDEELEPETEPPLESPEEEAEVAAIAAQPVTEMVPVDGDPELIEIFLEEARELLESIESSFTQWREDISASEPVSALERTLHTLKGGARLAGAMPIGDLSHAFESFLTAVDYARIEASPQAMELAQAVIDRLAEQIDDLSNGPEVRPAADLLLRLDDAFNTDRAALAQVTSEPSPEPEAEEEITPQESGAAQPAESDAGEAPALDGGVSEAAPEEASIEQPLDEQPASGPPPAATAPEVHKLEVPVDKVRPVTQTQRTPREQVRVRSELLDRLVNHAGEVSIYRARVEQQNNALGFNLAELDQTVERLRNQLRQMDIETEAQILFRYEQDKDNQYGLDEAFDPLELDRFSTIQQVSRSLLETVNDLNNIYRFLDELQKETDTLLLQQSRVMTDLQDGLMRTRMVPMSHMVPRLHRVVRQTCNPLGKQAELTVLGAESELDRNILERMIGPFEHLLRNAVSHGIERPEERRRKGKDPQGRITLDVRREGNDVLITIGDDGGGIDVDAIRRRAIEKGLLDPQAVVTDNDILQFVFEHGFSTAGEVTQIAGRGVGLDVVVSEVKQLGGSLDIASEPGAGTRFIIRLPLTLAIADALLVELGEEIYAIPHTSIEGVVRVSLDELSACYAGTQESYNYAGQDYQVRYLGNLLNVSQLELSDQRKWYPMLLVRAGDHHVALQIDGLIGNRQIVVKSVGPQLGTVRYISGGTILGDGRVALILDVTALVRLDLAHTVAPAAGEEAEVDPGVGRSVMVVDDSITVRKVTGRLLERHGMHVITAKDGVDAVAMLQEHRPDVMLLDIEMPRMDGYELARHMQNSPELQDIPIIMITSRSGEKHRNLAFELGVKRYLGKPYQEAELLENIYDVLRENRA